MAEILRDCQTKAMEQMKNGCILCGGVGSGKSRTAIGYYYTKICNGSLNPLKPLKESKDLYIITTAHKRDTNEWDSDLAPFLLSTKEELNLGKQKIVVDSWNNIKKYDKVENSFFIFDEQRVVGKGTWVASFIRITRKNEWVLLSATPGDNWMDYIPVFIANGFYKNRTQFIQEHVIYSRFSKFPKVDRYVGIRRLERLRNNILIDIDYQKPTEQHHIDLVVSYNQLIYKDVLKRRWNYTKQEPIQNASELCYELRKIVNTDQSRIDATREIVRAAKKIIIFYNFDYELDILKNIDYGEEFVVNEWNGHKHQPIPEDESNWVYLVQYTAGCEGWNCISTDTVLFFSQNYSYKVMVQAAGRIDRLTTPYKDLYYYHLKTKSSIDVAIDRAIKSKKKFNESRFANF